MILSTATVWSDEGDSGEKPGIWRRFLDWREARLDATDTYVLSTQGLAYAALQDERMTPLVYRALGAGLRAGERSYRPKEIVLSAFAGQYTAVLNKATLAGDYSYMNPRGTLDWIYLRRIPGLPLAAGGGITATGNMRILSELGNSALNYDVVASVSAAARWEQAFRLFDRPAWWHVGLKTPVFSYLLRHPGYAVSYGGSRTAWAAPWRFYRLRLDAGISRLLDRSEENRLAIEYHYDFYGANDRDAGHRLTLGAHSITVGYALKTR